MLAWKTNENIDFDFANCQLNKELFSTNEAYIKSKVRERLQLAGKYKLIIGEDTRYKYKYVLWEAEVALEKGCTIIGINLDGSRRMKERTCPPVIRNIGAIFVPFSPHIVARAIQNYQMKESGNYYYKDDIYRQLGYDI